MGQALDLVDVVVGTQRACPDFRKVRNPAATIGDAGTEITRIPLCIDRKSRMRLKADTRLQPQFVNTFGNPVCRRISCQRPTRSIEIARHRHLLNRRRNQRVGTLEVVILQRRFVNLRGEGNFVFCIGLRRIEMLRTVSEGRVQNIGAAGRSWIRVIPGVATSGNGDQPKQCKK